MLKASFILSRKEAVYKVVDQDIAVGYNNIIKVKGG